GAFAARPGRARNPGEPAAYGAGARRVLQGPRQTRRPGHTRPRQQADHGRAEDAWPRARRAAADVVPAADRRVRATGGTGRRRGPGTPRRIAVGPRVLHRGGGATTARSRPVDRAAA